MADDQSKRTKNLGAKVPEDTSTSMMLTPSQLNLPTLSVLINDVSELARYRPKAIARVDDASSELAQDAANSNQASGDRNNVEDWGHALSLIGLVDSKAFAENETSWTVSATHTSTNRRVVLQISKTEATGQLNEEFTNRAQKVAKLKHPCIPEILFCGKLKGVFPYYTTELLDGYSFDEIRPGLHMPGSLIDWQSGNGAVILKYILNAARAIEYAHSQGISHGEIQPSNFKIANKNQSVQVMDWGVLRFSSGNKRDGAEPNEAQDDSHGLGITLYGMVHNCLPTDREKSSPIQSESKKRTPPDLEAIVQKSTRLAPAERYESMKAFANDLERFLKKRPVEAYTESLTALNRTMYSIGRVLNLTKFLRLTK